MADKSLNKKEMLESSKNFGAAYESHANSIYKFLLWRTKNPQLSEDLTSTTFEKAWVARKSFKGGSVQAWLYRIARNVLIDHWRKTKELSIDNIDDLQSETDIRTEEKLDLQFEVVRLKKAVDKLPSEMQSVVSLRFIQGMSSKQVAKKLGISHSNTRIIQYRALKKLREYLR